MSAAADKAGLAPVPFTRRRASAPRLSKPYVPGKRDERFWTDAEDAVIRQHFPAGGAPACLVHLPPHRTPSGVYQRAGKLGLSGAAKRGGGPKVRIPVPDDIDETIRAAWGEMDGRKRGEVEALAGRLGVPRWWLTKRLTRLGLTVPHKKEPPWTAAEEALMANVPLHSPDLCARIFREHGYRRSPTAIIVKAKRLGLSRRATRDTLSAREAARILGVDDKTVTLLCIDGSLKAGRRGSKRLPQQGGDAWAIKPADLRAWVIEHVGDIDIRKVDKFAFVDLLVSGVDGERGHA